MCCKCVCIQSFARHTHRSETPTDSFYFYRYISIKMAMIVDAINRFIPSGYAQPAYRISLGSNFTGLDHCLEKFVLGVDLKHLWP